MAIRCKSRKIEYEYFYCLVSYHLSTSNARYHEACYKLLNIRRHVGSSGMSWKCVLQYSAHDSAWDHVVAIDKPFSPLSNACKWADVITNTSCCLAHVNKYNATRHRESGVHVINCTAASNTSFDILSSLLPFLNLVFVECNLFSSTLRCLSGIVEMDECTTSNKYLLLVLSKLINSLSSKFAFLIVLS